MFNWKHSLDCGHAKGNSLTSHLSTQFVFIITFRQEDTIEKAADYNFCKEILKEIFHIKMRNTAHKSPDYVR